MIRDNGEHKFDQGSRDRDSYRIQKQVRIRGSVLIRQSIAIHEGIYDRRNRPGMMYDNECKADSI